MGSFAALLGHAAGGFEQARQQDLARQHEDEQARRSMLSGFLGKLAGDETVHPDVRNAASQALIGVAQTPGDKALKWEKTLQPVHDAAVAVHPRPSQKFNAPPQPPLQVGDQTLVAPNASATLQPPPPPPGMFMSPEDVTALHAARAGATAGAELSGQIGARKQAIAGLPLPPEQQAAMSLGMPQMLYRGLSKTTYIDPATGQQALGTYNEMTHQVIGQDGQIVPNAVPLVPSLLPSERQGMVMVPQSDGTIKAMPVTSVTQKTLPPVPAQGQATAAKPTAKIGEGKTVGGKAPTPVVMIAPPTQPGGEARAVSVKPGGKVPTGAVTTSGYSQVSVPTSSTRTRSEFATGLIPAVDRAIVDVNHAAPKLGALKGRWNEFIAGTLGGGLDDDPEISGLRTEMGLIQTGMMVPHVGARGGVQLIAKFKGMIDSGKMDAPQLTAALKEMRKFLVTYAHEGDLKGWGKEPIGSVGGPPEQGPSGHMSYSDWKAAQGGK